MASRLIQILIGFLLLGMVGCASPAEQSPYPAVVSRQIPVQVSTGPAPPPRPIPDSKPREPLPGNLPQDDRFLQDYAQALKKIQTIQRPKRKDEKIYPIDLNLKNADLVETIGVLADTMGINYLIDPRVKGKASVRATGKLSQSELLSILETLLLVNGAALIRDVNVYKIVPADKVGAQALPVYTRGIPPTGMTVQVVFLEQTAAKEMMPVLKPLMSPGGSISEAANNSLILVDYPANLEKLLNLIHLIDTRSLAQTQIQIAKVDNTSPQNLISELEVIFSAYGALAPKEKFGVGFLPVPRLNSILVLAGSKPLMDRALYWIRQLDLKTDMLADIHVYHVENYKARNLANLLTQVYGGKPLAPEVKEVEPEDRRPTFLGQSGAAGEGGLGTGIMGGTRTSGLGQSGGGAGSIERRRGPGGGLLEGQKEQAVPLAEAAAPEVSPKEGVRIIPDEENNLLVIVAPPHEWRVISQLLQRLDLMPRQVLNEILIAEVRLTGDLKYGVEWFLNSKLVTPKTKNGTPSLNILQGPSAAFSKAIGGFTFAVRDSLNEFRGLIHMLAEEGKVNILASPHIMAANNQEARIQIGQDVPILTSQAVPLISQTTSLQTQTVEYRSTGIIMLVKPQINAKGLVTLDITQEVSAAVPTTTGVEASPTFIIRTAKTSLITGDNQTIVLGGLIREDATRTAYGIPGLRKIPLLGALFGSEEVKREKTELLVLITPHIISSLEEGARLTDEVKHRIPLEELSPEWQKKTQPRPPRAP
ncbi:MAG: type II secretion system secretin GspD [Deltaproteobacteria bacterium]|nr:type II secretion system secretin GspD [Deltaproteobacteria bacterium]